MRIEIHIKHHGAFLPLGVLEDVPDGIHALRASGDGCVYEAKVDIKSSDGHDNMPIEQIVKEGE